ncbi:fumarylacetoacetate hydrolase family protein [Diaphorobacter caeni]|uniref:fumarylacetoacetate hydrolase family protein n=1 Tax=Diaphorobacter caeni TaxID=2784387 RepID=UPI0018901A85|nr:fumarylacetoacetate hydrolase family protein [Diaphorobacter caeni]MBF5005436.1 fumarylacetoacetate hydrolase family protein [Diaphorobacter caeni]
MSHAPDARHGTVYGALLNERATLVRMARQFGEAPYKAPPQAPVLYIKPRNTHAGDGAAVPIPRTPGVVRVDATLGLVIGRTAWQVTPDEAMSHVSGYVIASDLTLPYENHYRPAIRQRCRDLFCPMSAALTAPPRFMVSEATLDLQIRDARGHVSANWRRGFADLVRSAPRLLSDVSAFMTLTPGDVLLLGPGEDSPEAHPGDTVQISVPGLGQLRHTLIAEAAPQGTHA